MKNLLCYFLLFSLIQLLTYQQIPPIGCKGSRNNQPLIIDDPVLVKTVKNGKLFTVPYDGRNFYIILVNGTGFEMGFAYGELLKNELNEMIPATYTWLKNFLTKNTSFIQKLPKFMQNFTGSILFNTAKIGLDLNYVITKKYLPQRYIDEFNGISKGAGIKVKDLRRINYIGEMLKASCSVFGAYGQSTKNLQFLHLRTLDWEEHASIARWPSITVYHPSENNAVVSANIAWVGYIATLTAYNAEKIGIGERLKGAPWKEETRFGQPWQFVLRDVVHFSKNISEALQILKTADRTCTIYLGLGSKKDNDFRICEYSYKYMNDFNWQQWPEHKKDDRHPKMKEVLWQEYRDETECFKTIISQNYGNINEELIYRDLVGYGQTGDSQVAVINYDTDVVYLSYPNPVTYLYGYATPILKVDLHYFFSKELLK